jgi:hypothetical protein
MHLPIPLSLDGLWPYRKPYSSHRTLSRYLQNLPVKMSPSLIGNRIVWSSRASGFSSPNIGANSATMFLKLIFNHIPNFVPGDFCVRPSVPTTQPACLRWSRPIKGFELACAFVTIPNAHPYKDIKE